MPALTLCTFNLLATSVTEIPAITKPMACSIVTAHICDIVICDKQAHFRVTFYWPQCKERLCIGDAGLRTFFWCMHLMMGFTQSTNNITGSCQRDACQVSDLDTTVSKHTYKTCSKNFMHSQYEIILWILYFCSVYIYLSYNMGSCPFIEIFNSNEIVVDCSYYVKISLIISMF